MAEIDDTDSTPTKSAERELEIRYWPREHDTWTGASSQLIAEGILPADIEWPIRTSSKRWSDEHFDYCLHRSRPDGRIAWKDVDLWRLQRWSKTRSGEVFAAQKALQEAVFRESHAGLIQSNQLMRAYYDKGFQAFKAKLLPERNMPGRRSKLQRG